MSCCMSVSEVSEAISFSRCSQSMTRNHAIMACEACQYRKCNTLTQMKCNGLGTGFLGVTIMDTGVPIFAAAIPCSVRAERAIKRYNAPVDFRNLKGCFHIPHIETAGSRFCSDSLDADELIYSKYGIAYLDVTLFELGLRRSRLPILRVLNGGIHSLDISGQNRSTFVTLTLSDCQYHKMISDHKPSYSRSSSNVWIFFRSSTLCSISSMTSAAQAAERT